MTTHTRKAVLVTRRPIDRITVDRELNVRNPPPPYLDIPTAEGRNRPPLYGVARYYLVHPKPRDPARPLVYELGRPSKEIRN